MGYSISWLALGDVTPAAVWHLLGVEETGQIGLLGASPLVGRLLPTGWYVLAANRCDRPLISSGALKAVSAVTSAVAVSIEEHVMFSSVACWNHGSRDWSAEHFGDRDVRDLRLSGTLPAAFAALREAAFGRQKAETREDLGVDWFFELPLDLAQLVVGFRHDDAEAIDTAAGFEALHISPGGLFAGRVRPWWNFWTR